MSDQKCGMCGELLVHGDKVRAEIITRFVALKSKIAYALERPSECHAVEHVSCDDPKGEPNNDIDPYFPNVGD